MHHEDLFGERSREQVAEEGSLGNFLHLFLIKKAESQVPATKSLLPSILLLTLVPTSESYNVGSCFGSVLFDLLDKITFP